MLLAADSLQDNVAEPQEYLNFTIQKRFAAQSEKHPPDPLSLSNEAKALEQEEAAVEPPGEDQTEIIDVPAHQRNKPGSKPLPEMWPRVEVIR